MAHEEPLRRFIIESSRQRALRSRHRGHSHAPLAIATGILAAGVLVGTWRSFARTAAIVAVAGFLAAKLMGGGRHSNEPDEGLGESGVERSRIDEASRQSFPASDPPAAIRL